MPEKGPETELIHGVILPGREIACGEKRPEEGDTTPFYSTFAPDAITCVKCREVMELPEMEKK